MNFETWFKKFMATDNRAIGSYEEGLKAAFEAGRQSAFDEYECPIDLSNGLNELYAENRSSKS